MMKHKKLGTILIITGAYTKKRIENIVYALKGVYVKPKYILFSIMLAFLLIVFNLGVINYRIYLNHPSFIVAKAVFLGTFYTLPILSIILLFTASMLIGILASLMVYHITELKRLKNSYAIGSSGIVLGVFAPACTSCGVGLVTLLGGAGLVGALPFGGIELGLLGNLLLVLAIISLSAKISNKVCSNTNSFDMFIKENKRVKQL